MPKKATKAPARPRAKPALVATPEIDLEDPSLFINRELSLLEFQRRVLAEAADPGNKLLERIKFLSIFSSNLDEFFMVRVAGIMQQVEKNVFDPTPDGRTPQQQLAAIGQVVRHSPPTPIRSIATNCSPASAKTASTSSITPTSTTNRRRRPTITSTGSSSPFSLRWHPIPAGPSRISRTSRSAWRCLWKTAKSASHG